MTPPGEHAFGASMCDVRNRHRCIRAMGNKVQRTAYFEFDFGMRATSDRLGQLVDTRTRFI